MKKRIFIIIVSFCTSFSILIALSVISMNRFVKYVYYSNFSDTSGIIIDKIYQTEIHLRDIDRCERGYMLTKDTTYRTYLFLNIDSLKDDIIDMNLMTDDNTEIQKAIDVLKDSISLRLSALKININYVDTTNQSMLSKYFYDSREYMRACNRQIRRILKLEEKVRSERQMGEHIYEVLTTHTLGYLFLIFCLVTLVLFFLMINELRRRIKFQSELQVKLFDLRRSHIELEEIAYAASHDLQEPLRKIQIFSNMLMLQQAGRMNQENQEILERIYGSANKMQTLVADLLSLTSLSRIDQVKTEVDLNRVLQYLVIDMDETIKGKNAIINICNLPIIIAYDKQIKLLFAALLDNSLKFTREGVQPLIQISSAIVSGKELADNNPNLRHEKFYCIKIEDNGVGFDNQFMSKMFKVFQHLGASGGEHSGKGIGLAICQRIMANHEGYIIAEGKPGMGASFQISFPIV